MSHPAQQGTSLIPAPQWTEDRPFYPIDWPRLSLDYEAVVNGLSELVENSSSAVLTGTLHDKTMVSREWTGSCSPPEFALMLASVENMTMNVKYPDGSAAWIDMRPGSTGWRWCTSGQAQDAARRLVAQLRKLGWRRRLAISWAEIFAGSWVIVVWSIVAWATTPDDNFRQIVFWLALVFIPLAVAATFMSRGSDHSGLTGRSRRRYLQRISGGQNLGAKAGRFLAFPKLDITNVLAGGFLGVILTLLIAMIARGR